LSPLQCRYKYYKDLTSQIGRSSAQGQAVKSQLGSHEFKNYEEESNDRRNVYAVQYIIKMSHFNDSF